MTSDKVFLQHILDEISFLIKETEGINFEQFKANELLKRAAARSIEIIGEAVKSLSSDLRKKHGDIDWKKIAGMRDKVIHLYFGVNWDIVWDVITKRLPELRPQIERMLQNSDAQETTE